MKMRGFAVVLSLIVCICWRLLLQLAYENFIPLGTGYSTNVDSLPTLTAKKVRIIQHADVYETELYRLGRKTH